MSASWLITDGFSGEANGVNKIVTIGLYSGAAAAAPDRPTTWLSPSPQMYLFLIGVGLLSGALRWLP